IPNHSRSGHRLWEKLRAELRIAAKTPAIGKARLSTDGGHFAQGLLGGNTGAQRGARAAERTHLGHGGDSSGKHSEWGAHRARARRRRNGSSSGRRRLCCRAQTPAKELEFGCATNSAALRKAASDMHRLRAL